MRLLFDTYQILDYFTFGMFKNIEAECTDYSSYLRYIEALIKENNESVLKHSLLSVQFVTNNLVFSELASFNLSKTFDKQKVFEDELIFIIPPWIDVPAGKYDKIKIDGFPEGDIKSWLMLLLQIEQSYVQLKELKWPSDKLMLILPYDIMVDVVFTGNYFEWRELFRSVTSQVDHRLGDQTKQLLYSVLFDLKNLIPCVFDDLNI